jgi:hypothetical protein
MNRINTVETSFGPQTLHSLKNYPNVTKTYKNLIFYSMSEMVKALFRAMLRIDKIHER